jgi:hypothetical protein
MCLKKLGARRWEEIESGRDGALRLPQPSLSGPTIVRGGQKK